MKLARHRNEDGKIAYSSGVWITPDQRFFLHRIHRHTSSAGPWVFQPSTIEMFSLEVNKIYTYMQSLGLYRQEFATLKQAKTALELAFYSTGGFVCPEGSK